VFTKNCIRNLVAMCFATEFPFLLKCANARMSWHRGDESADSSPAPCPDDHVTIAARSSAVIRGLALVLHHHDCSRQLIGQMEKQVAHYLNTSLSEKVWIKRIKYVLAYPLARYLRNELPPCPDLIWRPAGAFKRWLKARIVAFNSRNTHLLYSWLQCKRSALPVSEDLVDDAYHEHFDTLTKADNCDDLVIDQIFRDETFNEVLNSVQKQLTATFPDTNDFLKECPSQSSCYRTKRSQGGAFGRLSNLSKRSSYEVDGNESWLDGFEVVDASMHIGFEDLVSMEFDPYLVGSRGGRLYRTPRVVEHYNPSGEEDWESLAFYNTEPIGVNYFDSKEFPDQNEARWWNDREYPLREEQRDLRCEIQAVLEPLKIRIISKGEYLEYYRMKPLQIALHDILRKMPCFRLIGKPFCASMIYDLVQKSDEHDEWFSVDYSAATDNLSWTYSRKILKRILKYCPKKLRDEAMQVLGPHHLFYPLGCGGYGYRGTQQNGQLMGSILSFPILNLANLGVYLAATATHHQNGGWSTRDRLSHVLVNGDDMVYAAPRRLWEKHIRIGAGVGLSMSVGKAYHHRTYLNINSTSVHYTLGCPFGGRGGMTPKLIPFLNVGLYFGVHKVLGKSENGKREIFSTYEDERRDRELRWKEIRTKPLNLKPNRKLGEVENREHDPFGGYLPKRLEGDITDDFIRHQFAKAHMSLPEDGIVNNLNQILAGSLTENKKVELLANLLKMHDAEIKEQCTSVYEKDNNRKRYLFTRNLFIPFSLGGMGVDCPVGFKFKTSKIQHRIATDKIRQWDLGVNFHRPLEGIEFREVQNDPRCPWVKAPTISEVDKERNNINIRMKLLKVQGFSALYRIDKLVGEKRKDNYIDIWNESEENYKNIPISFKKAALANVKRLDPDLFEEVQEELRAADQ